MKPSLVAPGKTAALDQIIEMIGRASLGLHISGEEGVGKEAIVRLMVARSSFRGFPFIRVNCPALAGDGTAADDPCINATASTPNPSSLALYKLFHQGILFLYAIDALEARLQNRVTDLIRRKMTLSASPAGRMGRGMLTLSTSTRSLEDCVASGALNPCLGDLLGGISIHIPPLRHSPARIDALVDYFLGHWLGEWRAVYPRPSKANLVRMRAYHWPGNVKELAHVVQRAIRANDWDAAVRSLGHGNPDATNYSTVSLTSEALALMPDVEITQGRTLKSLAERSAPEEVGLMDLLILDEMAADKPH